MTQTPDRPPRFAPAAPAAPYRHRDFFRFLMCRPFYWMLLFLVVEALLAASTTALIIQAGRDMGEEEFLISDFVWIVVAQSAAYLVGATSWVFAERAGFGAFGRYMLRFARDNRHQPALLTDKTQRDHVEPFLTNEVFHILFELIYELEADLKLFFGLVFNSIVLGFAIDAGLPVVYASVFFLLLALQWLVRKPVAAAYLAQQRTTNRMIGHTYTAWDNITTGNRYNYRLWHAGFKLRLRGALVAQIRAILAREGIAAISGIFALVVVFSYLAWVAGQNRLDAGMLIALAATLPRQIELSYNVHGLASGWNDLLAVWTRIGGACAAMRPAPDADFEGRIRFEGVALSQAGVEVACTSVDEAMARVQALPTGRLLVRGSNGSGKSTLLVALKGRLGSRAFYWPTSDKLAFVFTATQAASAAGTAGDEADEGDDTGQSDADSSWSVLDSTIQPDSTSILPDQPAPTAPQSLPTKTSAHGATGPLPQREATYAPKAPGFSSGEKQLKSLQEIVARTDAQVYLLDEWDANLDAKNRAAAEALVASLAARALVVEISHRDRV
jgi:ABC-type multidrug transport system fused ATPase/permease subunit